jgi:hypothetical protein
LFVGTATELPPVPNFAEVVEWYAFLWHIGAGIRGLNYGSSAQAEGSVG